MGGRGGGEDKNVGCVDCGIGEYGGRYLGVVGVEV